MADLETFNTNENATTVRTKINAAIARINTLDDASEIIAKIDIELGSTNWKDSALTFTTVAALKAFDIGGLANNTVAIVLGKTVIGDGTGAVYFWSAGSGQTANGRDIIIPNSAEVTGRWVIVGKASGRQVLSSISSVSNANDTELATHAAIKNYIDDNSTASDLVYVPVLSVSPSPTVTGGFGAVTGLSYDSGYINGSVNGTAQYFLSSLKTTNAGDIANIRAVHIEVDVRMSATIAPREATLTVTYPDGTTQPLLISDLESGQNSTSSWVNQVATVPVNSDTTSLTISGNVDGDGQGERIAYKIVGATTILNASNLTTTQVFGNSGLLYSGEEVFNGSVTAGVWTEGVNLLPSMGGKAGRYKVTLKVEHTAGGNYDLAVRPGDETFEISRVASAAAYGAGTSGCSLQASNFGYLQVMTDESGLIDLYISQGGSCAITLESYMPLDDVPVVTKHFLGDVEFINPIDIINPASDLTGTTGWVSINQNLAWAGASTLLLSATITNKTSGPLNATLLVRAENGAIATPIITSEGTSLASNHVQALAPVSTAGNFQYNWSHGNGPDQIQLTSLRVVGYIKSDIKSNAYPYYNVTIHGDNNLTLPTDFVVAGTLGKYREPSFGSIEKGKTVHKTESNSMLFEMNVNVLSDTTITQDLIVLNRNLYIYVDGDYNNPVYSLTSAALSNRGTSELVTWNQPLTAGFHSIQIVYNDQNGGDAEISLIGDIISDNVQFIGFSGSPDILDEDNMESDSETALATQQSIKAYIDNSKPLFHVQDHKLDGVTGGASLVGINYRQLNSIVTDEIADAELTSNQIVLPTGTYLIDAIVPSIGADRTQAFLYNETTTTNVIVGSTAYSNDSTNGSTVYNHIRGQVTVAAATETFSITQYCQLARSEGLGVASIVNIGAGNIYTDCLIWKIK
jgi:hypothetical protein